MFVPFNSYVLLYVKYNTHNFAKYEKAQEVLVHLQNYSQCQDVFQVRKLGGSVVMDKQLRQADAISIDMIF